MMAKPPADIDVLLSEGTNLGSDKPVMSEKELESDFAELFKRTKGRVFISWSGQNIDRTVTIYRAAKKTGRTLAIDLYTADVLDRISEGSSLPRPGFPNLKVVVTKRLRNNYRNQGREEFIERIAQARQGISAKKLEGGHHIIMLRSGLLDDYQKAGVVPTAEDAYNFSMWRGYLSEPFGPYYSARWTGCKTPARRLPTFIRVVTPLQPIFANSQRRFGRRWSCRCMARNGTRNRTVSERCAASPTGTQWRFHDESARVRQRSQYPYSCVLEYLVRGWTLMTLSGIRPDMSPCDWNLMTCSK
jgi:hypothetical protein